MKFQYSKIAYRTLWLSTFLMVLAVIALIRGGKQVPTVYFQQQVAAARKMRTCIDSLKAFAEKQSIQVSLQFDPNQTFLIGEEYTPITTTIGNLEAKRTAANPDFAALLVRWLHELQLQPGDVAAIGCSGSFPGLILASLCASEAMQLKPVIITSLGASSYGANRPDFTWLDMEKYLFRKGLIHHRSIAALPGGVGDAALDLSPEGKQLLLDAIQRNRMHLIEIEDIAQNIEARALIYTGEAQPKVFINIGGTQINIGDYYAEKKLSPGLNTVSSNWLQKSNSMVAYFARHKIPVIHFLEIEHIARTNGLAVDPVPLPETGQSRVYFEVAFSWPVKLSVLILYVLALLPIGLSGYKNRSEDC